MAHIHSSSTNRTTVTIVKVEVEVIQVKDSRLIARIEGAKRAKGDYVVNLDSDMYFSENFRGFEEKVIALGEITVGKGLGDGVRGLYQGEEDNVFLNLAEIMFGVDPR